MRIVIAGQTYYPGNNGQAIFTIHLAEGLARAGHEVHVLVPWRSFHHASQTINGVAVHYIRSINLSWIHPEVCVTFTPGDEILRLLQQIGPDIVHIQDHYFLCSDTARAARRMSLPVMGTNHFLPENVLPYLAFLPVSRRFKIRVLWSMMLATYNHLRVITTPTQTAADILSKQAVHVRVIPVSCGVDTQQFYPAPRIDRNARCVTFGLDPEKVTCLYVGRLDNEKRIDLLLRAAARLKEQGTCPIQLVIAGQGAASGALRGLAQSLKLGDTAKFLGYVPNADLPRLYQTGQIFCMPSPEELQSIATLEAMASGLPILAANARALPELVTHGQNGYLFAPNQAAAVAAGLAELAAHRADWPRMGRASRERAEKHSLENTIRRYESIYQEIVGK